MTPADLLREYAALLKDSTATTMTEAGQHLDLDLTFFLNEIAVAEAPETEAIYDLFMLTARAFFAIHLAHHDGQMDREVLNQHVIEFGIAVGREMAAHSANFSKKGTH